MGHRSARLSRKGRKRRYRRYLLILFGNPDRDRRYRTEESTKDRHSSILFGGGGGRHSISCSIPKPTDPPPAAADFNLFSVCENTQKRNVVVACCVLGVAREACRCRAPPSQLLFLFLRPTHTKVPSLPRRKKRLLQLLQKQRERERKERGTQSDSGRVVRTTCTRRREEGLPKSEYSGSLSGRREGLLHSPHSPLSALVALPLSSN